jgi:hypothetical protein
MSIDYKLLLAKYIEHVGAEEGSDLIGCLYKAKTGNYEGMSLKVDFTPEEHEALKSASAHIWERQ